MGIVGLVTGLIRLTVFLTTGISPPNLEILMLMLMGAGGGALASNVLSLPEWAHQREGQMEYLAKRVGVLLAEDPKEEDAET
jgi:hypothetical protein